MAFKIAGSKKKPGTLSKVVPAFEVEEDDDNMAVSSQHAAQVHMSRIPDTAEATQQHVVVQQLIDQGGSHAEKGDFASALKCWDRALWADPSNARIHEMRAQVLNSQGRMFEAIQSAQQAVDLKPDWPDAHITLARVQLNFGEPLLALRSYQAAARLQPDHPDLAAEMPSAQMYAKLHAKQQQQQPGSRAHVVRHLGALASLPPTSLQPLQQHTQDVER